MKNIDKKYVMVMALLLITAGLVFADARLTQNTAMADPEKLPLTIGSWHGLDFPVDERIKNILETDYILSRDYANQGGKHALLSIVYYPDNKIGFHNPESCNTGIGLRLVEKDVQSLKIETSLVPSMNFRVNRLLMEGEKRDKVILYFYISGNYVTHDYLKFRLHMMKQQMSFRRPSGALIQIHGNIDSTMEATVATLEDFIKDFVPLLPGYLY